LFLNKKNFFFSGFSRKKKNPGSIPGRKKNPGSFQEGKKIQEAFQEEFQERMQALVQATSLMYSVTAERVIKF
jgi:hypothetical protein